MAFVLVQHLDPKHESRLTDVLSRTTTMPVVTVTSGLRVEPNHVYVIPSNADMTIDGGVLTLTPRATIDHHLPIDGFFRSLAAERENRAIGVVLSGNGTDGTLGLKAIRAEGGLTFVQDAQSAKYPGMPHSASAAADFVLTPEGIARELARISRHPYVNHVARPSPADADRAESGGGTSLPSSASCGPQRESISPDTSHRAYGAELPGECCSRRSTTSRCMPGACARLPRKCRRSATISSSR
jgi:hypothetical protein